VYTTVVYIGASLEQFRGVSGESFVTSVYYDSAELDQYSDRLERLDCASLVRVSHHYT
jgi:SPX domain protein involved in polyphosphate accumulation